MIYFDEAGYSGGNLLDKDQPVYLLLSHNYTEEETKTMLEALLALSNAKELHFKNLKKYEKLRKATIDCLNHDLIKKDRICYYVVHKKYLIGLQMVDQLIEPVIHGVGEEIYQGGFNIATGNLLYIMGMVGWDKDLYEEMCIRFVIWMRSREYNDCALFYKSVTELHSKTKEGFRDILDYILLSTSYLDTIVPALSKYPLDITVSCFNAHCQYWGDVYGRPFDIIFDQSKQIEYWRGMIDFLTHSVPHAEVGFGSRKYKYPLLINSYNAANSHENIQLQLADVFASSLNYMFINWHNEADDDFSKEIGKSKLYEIATQKHMWPSKAVTPKELNMTDTTGRNPLDFIAEQRIKNPKPFNKDGY